MIVAEKDEVVVGLLEDERARCLEAVDALQRRVSEYPRGSLHRRRKRQGEKIYEYSYLVYREGGKVINKHVPAAGVFSLLNRLAERDRYRDELDVYKKRMRYLDALLAYSGPRR